MTLTVLDLLLHFAFTAWGAYAGLCMWDYVHNQDDEKED